MTATAVILLVIKASIMLSVLSLGLGARFSDTPYLLTHPRLFLRSLLAMGVVMPLVAMVIAASFDLHQAVKIALIALAVSPVPPILPKKLFKAGGSQAYVVALLITAALVAVVYIPVVVHFLARAMGDPVDVPAIVVAELAMRTVLAPLLVGLLVHRFAPAIAERASGPLGAVGTILLALATIPVLVGLWRQTLSLIGNGTVVAFAAFVVVGLAVGHLVGGPEPGNRGVLALATACRHPGIAIAVAHVTHPSQALALPAIALYLLVSLLVTVPYVRWRQRVHAQAAAVGPSSA